MGRNRPQRRQRLQGQQYTQQYQQPVAPKAFNQGALGSSKGDASYDPYSDTDGDGMVSITDYGAYMKNNPQGAGLSQPIPAQQPSPLDNQGFTNHAAMDTQYGARQSPNYGGYGYNQPQAPGNYGGFGGFGGGIGSMFNGGGMGQPRASRQRGGNKGSGQYKNGGLIRGYQDGGPMISEDISMMSGPGFQEESEMISGPGFQEEMVMESGPGFEEQMAMESGGEGDEVLQVVMDAKAALEGTHPDPMAALEIFIELFGEEELMSLKEYVIEAGNSGEDMFAEGMDSELAANGIDPINMGGIQDQMMAGYQNGGLIRGYQNGGSMMSDGMSDSIPGNIGGVEEVALSEGEYVVPADVVSGMGNGDTASGARRMRDMINKVRSSRTGMSQQPPSINPSTYYG